ncbi:hypothetical protein IGI37_003127 [Enterococcus sp. AZ194]|uniref:hypothetical protein n=1 Tax=Enterococcus sp. AZ194 TaxID=2774629 RepID=UPI003F297F07
MADIVQLQENGVKKYLKTHVKAVDGLAGSYVNKTSNETIDGIKTFAKTPLVGSKKVAVVEDTGWVNGTWVSGISNHANVASNLIKFRSVNGVVEFRGIGTNTKILLKNDNIAIANIPAQFIGSNTGQIQIGLMQGSITALWQLSINFSQKVLMLSRYRQVTDSTLTDIPANQWLTIHGTYLL